MHKICKSTGQAELGMHFAMLGDAKDINRKCMLAWRSCEDIEF